MLSYTFGDPVNVEDGATVHATLIGAAVPVFVREIPDTDEAREHFKSVIGALNIAIAKDPPPAPNKDEPAAVVPVPEKRVSDFLTANGYERIDDFNPPHVAFRPAKVETAPDQPNAAPATPAGEGTAKTKKEES